MLNSKKLFLRTNSANLTRSLVGIFDVCSSNLLFNSKIPCVVCLDIDQLHLQLLKRNPRRLFLFFSFYQQDLQSLECVTSSFALKALNENQGTLMLSLLEFHSWRLEIKGLPGTLWSRLWILVIDIVYRD